MEKKIRVVIIEDVEDDLIWLKERIEETFSETVEIVGEARTVTKAIELFKTEKPDAALMDIKLIGGSAFDILEALKRKNVNLPKIALMSAYNDVEYREKAINEYQNTIVNFIRRPYVEDWEAKLGKAFDAISLAIESTPKPTTVTTPEVEPEPTPTPSVKPTFSIESISGETVRINHADIRYLEAKGHDKYIYLSHDEKEWHRLTKSMKECLEQYPCLVQVSKSHAINRDFFDKTGLDTHNNRAVLLKGMTKKIKIGDEFKNFKDKLKP